MPWSDDRLEYWLGEVVSADRTRSKGKGGIQTFGALYPDKITVKNEEWFFGPNIEAMRLDFDRRYKSKKGGENSWLLILTSMAQCYTGDRPLSISNRSGTKISPRDFPLTHEEALELCDNPDWGLPQLRSNSHILPPQIRQILAILTWNRRVSM